MAIFHSYVKLPEGRHPQVASVVVASMCENPILRLVHVVLWLHFTVAASCPLLVLKIQPVSRLNINPTIYPIMYQSVSKCIPVFMFDPSLYHTKSNYIPSYSHFITPPKCKHVLSRNSKDSQT